MKIIIISNRYLRLSQWLSSRKLLGQKDSFLLVHFPTLLHTFVRCNQSAKNSYWFCWTFACYLALLINHKFVQTCISSAPLRYTLVQWVHSGVEEGWRGTQRTRSQTRILRTLCRPCGMWHAAYGILWLVCGTNGIGEGIFEIVKYEIACKCKIMLVISLQFTHFSFNHLMDS